MLHADLLTCVTFSVIEMIFLFKSNAESSIECQGFLNPLLQHGFLHNEVYTGEAVQSDGIMGSCAYAAHNWACNVQNSEGADLSLSLSKELATLSLTKVFKKT